MSLQPTSRERLGPQLQQICRDHGVYAGIRRVTPGPPAPAEEWEWWAYTSCRSAYGSAPSEQAARMDVWAGLRKLGIPR